MVEWSPSTKLTTAQQARKRAAALRQQYPNATVLEPMHLGGGVPSQLLDFGALDALARMANLNRQQYEKIREKLAEARQAMGFRAHLMPARDIPGYSADFERAGADYIMGLASHLARSRFRADWENAIGAIPSHKSNLRKYAETYHNYFDSPQEELQGLRQTAYVFYLAAVPMTAAMNLTQPFLTSFPLLSGLTNPITAGAQLTRAYAEAMLMIRGATFEAYLKPSEFFNPEKAPQDVRRALRIAWEKGILAPMTTQETMGLARNRAELLRKVGRNTRLGIEFLAHMFMTAERLNRIITFMAAYRLAAQPGRKDAILRTLDKNALAQLTLRDAADFPSAFAEWVVDETQFRTGKVNRTSLQRGVGTAIFQFQDYAWQMMELYARTAVLAGPRGKLAFAMMLLLLYSVAGLWGLPFAERIRLLTEQGLRKFLERDVDLKVEFREAMQDMGASTKVAEMLANGSLRYFDESPEVSSRIGLGSIGPDPARPMSVLGVPADLMWERWQKAGVWAHRGELGMAAGAVAPNFLKNWIEAEAWAESGVRSRKTGAKIVHEKDLTSTDIWLKRLGARSRRIAEAAESEYAQDRAGHAMDEMRRSFYYKLAINTAKANKARATGDADAELQARTKIEEARQDVIKYNDGRPVHEQIIIDPNALAQAVAKEMLGPDQLRDLTAPRQARERRREIDKNYNR
jgi:hypothetical protein